MAKIAVLHASFLGGGAEAVCLWTLEALKDNHEVSLITFADVDFRSLNVYYGTHLTPSDVDVVVPYRASRAVKALTSNTLTFTARQHLLSRWFKRIAHQYSVCFSTFNEMDFGRRGIQFVYFPMFSTDDQSVRDLLSHPDSRMRRMFRKSTAVLTGFSQTAVRRNFTLTCSDWSAGVIERLWHVPPRVIYPPVPSAYEPVPWDDRLASFLCISRIVPEKKLERAISIVEGVRLRGFDVHLRIVGGSRSGINATYYDHIRKLQQARQDWIFLDHDLSRADLARLLTSYKYGLHVRDNEQFGIGVAEMLLAGCIPFVPDSGGQAEIVSRNPLLTFGTEHEGIEKIVAVLEDDRLQLQLRHSLAENRGLFSEQIFMTEVRQAVADFTAGAAS